MELKRVKDEVLTLREQIQRLQDELLTKDRELGMLKAQGRKKLPNISN